MKIVFAFTRGIFTIRIITLFIETNAEARTAATTIWHFLDEVSRFFIIGLYLTNV